MMKRLNVFIFMALALFIFAMPIKVEAETLNDLYKELKELQFKKATQDKTEQDTKFEKIQTNKEISDTFKEISNCEKKIEEARIKIEELNLEIEDKTEEIERLMRSLQVTNGGNVYLEYVFGATSFTDFIYRSAIVEQLTGYNDELIDEMYALIEENKKLQIELSNKKVELNNLAASLEKKLAKLNAALSDIDIMQVDISTQIKIQQQTISYYESSGCGLNDDLLVCADIPYTDGFIRPLPYGKVSSEFGYREYVNNGRLVKGYHRGIDIAGNPEGTPVFAAAAGVVSAIVYKDDCGGNMVYVTHNIKGKTYTSVYMHLLEIKAEKNQVVFATSVIGTVGGSSTSSVNGGYDTCTTGAHLHLGIGVGTYGKATWENPRNYLEFPPKGNTYFKTRY